MSTPVHSRNVVIKIPQGLHARPADLLVRLASCFESKVEIVKGLERVDGKSILGILTLAAAQGTELLIEATGHDSEAAIEALASLIDHDFDESLVAPEHLRKPQEN
jgi:phosphotransferase system HPr (HPr) family protein